MWSDSYRKGETFQLSKHAGGGTLRLELIVGSVSTVFTFTMVGISSEAV